MELTQEVVATTAMLIRKPAVRVFQAFVDLAVLITLGRVCVVVLSLGAKLLSASDHWTKSRLPFGERS